MTQEATIWVKRQHGAVVKSKFNVWRDHAQLYHLQPIGPTCCCAYGLSL